MPKDSFDYSVTYSPRSEKLEVDGYKLLEVAHGLQSWCDTKGGCTKYGIVIEHGQSSDEPTHLHCAFRLATISRQDNVKQRLITFLWLGKPDWDTDEWKRTFKCNSTNALYGTVAGYFSKEAPDTPLYALYGFTEEELEEGRTSWTAGVTAKARKDVSVDKVYELIAQKLHDDGLGDPASDVGYRERIDDGVIQLYAEGFRFAKHGNRLYGPAAKLLITATYRCGDKRKQVHE